MLKASPTAAMWRSSVDSKGFIAGRSVGGQAVYHFLPSLQHLLVNVADGGVRPYPVEIIAPLHLPRERMR